MSSARKTRTEEVTARRRRRMMDDRDHDYNLSIDESLRDPNFVYRWVNAEPKRIQKLHRQDWDLVPQEDIGCEVQRHAEAAKGFETKTVLMRKPKDWFNEDHKVREDRRRALFNSAKKGESIMSAGADGLEAKDAYKPKTENRIEGLGGV